MNRYENLSVGNLDVEVIRQGGLDMFTKKFYVDPVNGSDGNPGTSLTNARKSFSAGKTLLTANKNEALMILGGASALAIASAITWDLSFTHLIGLNTGTPQNRSKLEEAAAIETMFTLSGNGCILANLYLMQGYDSSGHVSHVLMEITGDRNKLFRVHLAQGANATLAALTTTQALVLTGAEANLLEECYIGYPDQGITATQSMMTIASASKQNIFKTCYFVLRALTGGTASLFWNLTGQDTFQIFDKCLFLNAGVPAGGLAIDPAFDIVVTSGGLVFLKDCAVYTGTADCDLGDAQTVTQLIVSGNPSTAALSCRSFAATVTS